MGRGIRDFRRKRRTQRARCSASGIQVCETEQVASPRKSLRHVSACDSVKPSDGTSLGVAGGGRMTVSTEMTPRILIADDQADLLDALKLLLKGQGIDYDAVTSPDAALAALRLRAFDLVLMDLNYTGDTTSGREGIDLLARVQQIDELLPVIVMTDR